VKKNSLFKASLENANKMYNENLVDEIGLKEVTGKYLQIESNSITIYFQVVHARKFKFGLINNEVLVDYLKPVWH
jgi:hypothetical protein